MNLPDSRGWVFVVVSILTGLVFLMMLGKPELTKDPLFDSLAGSMVTGGFLVAVNYYFGSSKSSTSKDDVIAKQMDKQP